MTPQPLRTIRTIRKTPPPERFCGFCGYCGAPSGASALPGDPAPRLITTAATTREPVRRPLSCRLTGTAPEEIHR
jgi:hypothetical protein